VHGSLESIKRQNLLWVLMPLEGIAALIALLRIPSEPGSAFLFGYSASRLVVAAAAAVGILVLAMLAWGAVRRPGWWRVAASSASRFTGHPWRLFGIYCFLFTLFWVIAAFLGLSVSAAASELVILRAWLARMGLLLVWIELLILQAGMLLALQRGLSSQPGLFSMQRVGILLAIATLIYYVTIRIYTTALWDLRMIRLQNYIYLPALSILAWGGLRELFKNKTWFARLDRVMIFVTLAAVCYTFYRHSTEWVDWQNTPSKAYWHLLADAFLHGRLYLIQPESTHDLTMYRGLWYVPNPPLPALVLMPFVALLGVENINMVQFSIACGVINVLLVFWMLEKSSALGLIPTRRAGNLWITGLFAVGTMHWWLAILGRMWFLSQVLTLLFILLSILAVLYRRSPWLAGACLGAALLSRPNAFTIWPFLVGLFLYLNPVQWKVLSWKKILPWTIQSGIPVVLAVAALLVYNKVRFENFLDFGYVTINGADWILAAVRQYGMFNVHFIPINVKAMLINLPVIQWQNGCLKFSPGLEGISIFVTTPAFLYLFRRFQWNTWTVSAWISIALSAGLLLLYSNTGAEQPGYRYVMDFIAPMLLLMAVGVGERVSVWFKALAVMSFLSNAAALAWWFQKWWC
jgi:hypothetical protein